MNNPVMDARCRLTDGGRVLQIVPVEEPNTEYPIGILRGNGAVVDTRGRRLNLAKSPDTTLEDENTPPAITIEPPSTRVNTPSASRSRRSPRPSPTPTATG